MFTLNKPSYANFNGIRTLIPPYDAVVKRQFPQSLQNWLNRQAFALKMQAFGMYAVPASSAQLCALKQQVADVARKLIAEDEKVIHQLHNAPLEFKREILCYLQIIPITISAAFLGMSEKNLADWQRYLSNFGQNYAGAHCFSLKELQIIGENRGQIPTGLVADDVRDSSSVADAALDEVIMVEGEVAAAFTSMSSKELRTKLPRNPLMRRPYRLSDLEKIRVAKLNGEQV